MGNVMVLALLFCIFSKMNIKHHVGIMVFDMFAFTISQCRKHYKTTVFEIYYIYGMYEMYKFIYIKKVVCSTRKTTIFIPAIKI